MQKLIKLSDTHYVVVDDSEIKESDISVMKDGGKYKINPYPINNEYNLKITHSTEPLEMQKMNSLGSHFTFVKIKPLSLSDVEEAVCGYSVEKMADGYYKKMNKGHCDDLYPNCDQTLYEISYDDFKAGFNAHKELMKDKLFTIEDMRKAIEKARYIKEGSSLDVFTAEDISGLTEICTYDWKYMNSCEEIIESILPKNEWNCKVVDGKIELI